MIKRNFFLFLTLLAFSLSSLFGFVGFNTVQASTEGNKTEQTVKQDKNKKKKIYKRK